MQVFKIRYKKIKITTPPTITYKIMLHFRQTNSSKATQDNGNQAKTLSSLRSQPERKRKAKAKAKAKSEAFCSQPERRRKAKAKSEAFCSQSERRRKAKVKSEIEISSHEKKTAASAKDATVLV